MKYIVYGKQIKEFSWPVDAESKIAAKRAFEKLSEDERLSLALPGMTEESEYEIDSVEECGDEEEATDPRDVTRRSTT